MLCLKHPNNAKNNCRYTFLCMFSLENSSHAQALPVKINSKRSGVYTTFLRRVTQGKLCQYNGASGNNITVLY